MQHALAELALVGIVGGALGCWVIFYGLAYSAESLAHALFPGLVGAALLGLPLLLGGAVGVLGAAVAVAVFGRAPEIGRDTAVAVVISSLFGAGVVLALSQASPPGLESLLFGDLLGVSRVDLLVAGILAALALAALGALHRLLLAVGFDRGSSRALVARPLVADLALLALLATAIVIGVQGLGNLLVVAVLVGPSATARLFARRMAPMMTLAAGIAIAASLAGLYLSYYANIAAGASVAATVVVAYLLGHGVRAGRIPIVKRVLAVAILALACAGSAAASSPPTLRGRTIAIDPGHNGGNYRHAAQIDRLVNAGTLRKACDTTGTQTNAGYTEAAYTLDVSLRLASLLRAAGARVVLTRTTNTGWGPCITQRAAIGNRAHVSVALSIHADGGPSSGRGFHVIYPPSIRGLTDDIAVASYRLALAVRAAFHAGTGMPYATYIGRAGLDRRSDLGGLNLSDVPKVFVETGNMRNATDARLLANARFRRREAQALARGLAAFLAARP